MIPQNLSKVDAQTWGSTGSCCGSVFCELCIVHASGLALYGHTGRERHINIKLTCLDACVAEEVGIRMPQPF